MLRAALCGYSDAYIVVKGIISIENANNDANYDRKLAFTKQCTIYQLQDKWQVNWQCRRFKSCDCYKDNPQFSKANFLIHNFFVNGPTKATFKNNRDKIVCSNCHFVRRKWQKTFKKIKIKVKRNLKWNKYRSQWLFRITITA